MSVIIDMTSVEKENDKTCVICKDVDKKRNRLVNKCKCRGSLMWYHRKCIEKWLETSNTNHCPTCLTPISFEKKKKKTTVATANETLMFIFIAMFVTFVYCCIAIFILVQYSPIVGLIMLGVLLLLGLIMSFWRDE